MSKLPKQGRIKERYNAKPTKAERDYHLWLMDTFSCVCGCGGQSTVVHHPLQRHPKQRWRRDHEFVVPMADQCHRALHAAGSEEKFDPETDYPAEAYGFRKLGIIEGLL